MVILNRDSDAAECIVDLAVDLEPQECDSEYLLQCKWVPGSETMLVVVCRTGRLHRSDTQAASLYCCRCHSCRRFGSFSTWSLQGFS